MQHYFLSEQSLFAVAIKLFLDEKLQNFLFYSLVILPKKANLPFYNIVMTLKIKTDFQSSFSPLEIRVTIFINAFS